MLSCLVHHSLHSPKQTLQRELGATYGGETGGEGGGSIGIGGHHLLS